MIGSESDASLGTTRCPGLLCLNMVLPISGQLCTAWESVTSPSSLLLAHAPIPISLTAYGLSLGQPVFAGCCQPLLGMGPSRRYLCIPCIGAWTPTPQRSPGACARFFPEDSGLTLKGRRSALSGISLQCNFYRGMVFGAAVIHFRFKLLCSLGLPVAPTAESILPSGQPGRLHHAWIMWLPNHELWYRYLSDTSN